MGWPKGKPRPEGAGRRAGTPNKRSKDAQAIADRLGCDPFEILLRFAMGDHIALDLDEPVDPGIRMAAAAKAVKFLYPERKAMELSTDEQKGFAIVIKDYTTSK